VSFTLGYGRGGEAFAAGTFSLKRLSYAADGKKEMRKVSSDRHFVRL
jgi:hypothetical protein